MLFHLVFSKFWSPLLCWSSLHYVTKYLTDTTCEGSRGLFGSQFWRRTPKWHSMGSREGPVVDGEEYVEKGKCGSQEVERVGGPQLRLL